MTNAEKFKEVFGFMPDITKCPCQQSKDCRNCVYMKWWDKQYKMKGDDIDDGK